VTGQSAPAVSPAGAAQTTGGAAPPPKPSAVGPQGRFPYRLSNTDKSLGELGRSDTAVLLDNAFIDTASQTPLEVPEHLRAKADPGSYIVQSSRPLDATFYASLRQAEAVIFPVHHRPVEGTRGPYRVTMRHGVSRIHSGQRFTLGIIFHDAA